jgi:hypothetical protein
MSKSTRNFTISREQYSKTATTISDSQCFGCGGFLVDREIVAVIRTDSETPLRFHADPGYVTNCFDKFKNLLIDYSVQERQHDHQPEQRSMAN